MVLDFCIDSFASAASGASRYYSPQFCWWKAVLAALSHWLPAGISFARSRDYIQCCCYSPPEHLKNSMYMEFRGKEIKHEPRSRGLHSFPDHFREPEISF